MTWEEYSKKPGIVPCVRERKKNDHLFVDLENEDLVVEESENSLCAYRDGCYCTDHINISIEEQEVID